MNDENEEKKSMRRTSVFARLWKRSSRILKRCSNASRKSNRLAVDNRHNFIADIMTIVCETGSRYKMWKLLIVVVLTSI